MFPPTIEQLVSDEISENENDSDDEETENIEDEGIYGSDIVLITKLLTRAVIYIFIVYVYFHIKI